MANYIACRSCIEPDCTGCNMFVLEKALKQGRFDGLKDAGHTIRISTDVVAVRHGRWIKQPLDFDLCGVAYYQCSECGKEQQTPSNYCQFCGANNGGESSAGSLQT